MKIRHFVLEIKMDQSESLILTISQSAARDFPIKNALHFISDFSVSFPFHEIIQIQREKVVICGAKIQDFEINACC